MMVGWSEARRGLRSELRNLIRGVSLVIFCTYSVALYRGCGRSLYLEGAVYPPGSALASILPGF
jgi:hypothetical protein